MKQFKGIGASAGINIGKAYILQTPNFDISKNKVSNVELEINKINDAFNSAIDSLKKIREIALKKLGEEKAAIFDAHIEIINDPVLKEEINNLVINQKENGGFAIKTIFDKNIELFKSMNDDYFKERASDLKDVYNRIMSYFLNCPLPDLFSINEDVIIISHDLTPSETAMLDKKYVKGFATNIGGRTSHAAIMARTMEIPAVLGLNEITSSVKNNQLIAIDGNKGIVELDPNIDEWNKKIKDYSNLVNELKQYKDKTATTLDNHTVLLEANIGKPSDADNLENYGGTGIGLYRSEFLYMESSNWPDEETQFKAYKYVLEKNKDHLVIVRTLDIGGDKKLQYHKFDHEENPFLGYRAIRFTLDRLDIFKTQLKALLKASAFGKLGIMFPMICNIDELKKALQVVDQCKKELKENNIKFDENIQIGMMIEIPSTVFLADKFAKYVDFFSIGTNDLIQYTYAVDRMSQNISHLYQPNNPALLRAIDMVIKGASKHNTKVAMCGEMAGEIMSIPILLGLGQKGLDAFSMSATSILKAKKVICNIKHSECIELANKAMEMETTDEVNKLVEMFLKDKKLI